MLTQSLTLGMIPARFQQDSGKQGLDTLFAMARGVTQNSCCGGAHAQEITKWFDTNYHYLVPEFTADQQFALSWEQLFEEIAKGQALGHRLWVAPSCSLLHSPVDLDREDKLDPELKSWLAFAVQKCREVAVLAHALREPAAADVKAVLAGNRSRAGQQGSGCPPVAYRTGLSQPQPKPGNQACPLCGSNNACAMASSKQDPAD